MISAATGKTPVASATSAQWRTIQRVASKVK
jgi:hypothetical protein